MGETFCSTIITAIQKSTIITYCRIRKNERGSSSARFSTPRDALHPEQQAAEDNLGENIEEDNSDIEEVIDEVENDIYETSLRLGYLFHVIFSNVLRSLKSILFWLKSVKICAFEKLLLN